MIDEGPDTETRHLREQERVDLGHAGIARNHAAERAVPLREALEAVAQTLDSMVTRQTLTGAAEALRFVRAALGEKPH